jgi:drug/metabolite transporter (DMT)-like permease
MFLGWRGVHADPVYATALSTLYPIVTIVLARVYVQEQVRRRQRAGIALCLGGVVAISAGLSVSRCR